jgi:hypothetical protein
VSPTHPILPRFLYKPKPLVSNQISPSAIFIASKAIEGEQAFESQLAPDQQLQKKQIYLNYKSFYRLWDNQQRALIIAKLKKMGFSVSLIFDINSKPKAFEVDDDLKISIDKENKSIFLLDDKEIAQLSKIDNAQAIEKLSLASDDVIIMEYGQFEEVANIFRVNSLVTKHLFHSHLTLSYFNGIDLTRLGIRNSFLKNIKNKPHFTDLENMQELERLSKFQDFNAGNETVKNMLDLYINYYLKTSSVMDLKKSINHIENICKNNPENAKKIFAYFFSDDALQQISKDEYKIKFQKFILECFWFHHPDFDELIAKAQTIEGYENLDHEKIAEDLLDHKLKELKQFDPSIMMERISQSQQDAIKTLCQKKEFLKITVNSLRNLDDSSAKIYDFLMFLKDIDISIAFQLVDEPYEQHFSNLIIGNQTIEITYFIFYKLITNIKIDQEFGISDQFEDVLINYLTSSKLEYYPGNHIKDFFDILSDSAQNKLIISLKNKIQDFEDNLNEPVRCNTEDWVGSLARLLSNPKIARQLSINNIATSLKIFYQKSKGYLPSVLSILIHKIDEAGVKEIAKDILQNIEKLSGNESIDIDLKLTPQFEDFLLTLDDQKKLI